ncbi:hypothetical protein JOS77_00345 [Chromobacterium haemolyticum]|nr:hypothetical protein JOS77_00345 [Chromobacterium haemolyticum]
MPHAAQSGRFQRQRRGGDVHAHAANHDGHQLLLAQPQSEIVNALH